VSSEGQVSRYLKYILFFGVVKAAPGTGRPEVMVMAMDDGDGMVMGWDGDNDDDGMVMGWQW